MIECACPPRDRCCAAEERATSAECRDAGRSDAFFAPRSEDASRSDSDQDNPQGSHCPAGCSICKRQPANAHSPVAAASSGTPHIQHAVLPLAGFTPPRSSGVEPHLPRGPPALF